jgi:DNA adenine methylase
MGRGNAMKTPIRWAGSKKALLPSLRALWPGPDARYVEPFCGSACFFFDVAPKSAVLGDINSELITTYRALKADFGLVLECLRRLKLGKRSYYRLRSIDPASLSEPEQAARFLFLNRFCFNGIYRTNAAGTFNVPYGDPKGTVSFNIELLREAASLLKSATLINGDFEKVLDEAQAGDFVYLDPPYAVAKRRVFAEYHPDSFSERDIDRLNVALERLDARGVTFVLSYADSAEGRSVSDRWYSRRVRARRNVAGFAGDRKFSYEILASNRELVQ